MSKDHFAASTSFESDQNGQTITLSADPTCPQLCPIRATIRMVLRARHLKQPDSLPVACHFHKKKLVYLTGTRIAALYRQAAKAVHPTITKAHAT